jgi:hypothetical protein
MVAVIPFVRLADVAVFEWWKQEVDSRSMSGATGGGDGGVEQVGLTIRIAVRSMLCTRSSDGAIG